MGDHEGQHHEQRGQGEKEALISWTVPRGGGVGREIATVTTYSLPLQTHGFSKSLWGFRK
jgi:hypothetical protein